MRGLTLDLRYGLRSLRASPGLTTVALIVLTLGVGAMTAVYSVVDAVVIRPLPYRSPGRLVAVRQTTSARNFAVFSSVTSQDFADWSATQDVFESLAAVRPTVGFIDESGDEPVSLHARLITANLLSVLGVAPQLGRPFGSDTELRANPKVILISDTFWRRRFGADPGVVGRTLTLDNGNWQVLGVMPPGFDEPFSQSNDLWAPYLLTGQDRTRAQDHNSILQVVARLRPGVSMAQAQARMTQISGALAAAYPDWYKRGGKALVYSLADWTIGGSIRSWMLMLLGAGACVLLIACVNVANLVLARATSRGREIGIRAALGGGRWRLVRGLLVEGLLLSTTGTLLALVAGYWLLSILRDALPSGVPRAASIAMNDRVLVVAIVGAIVTGVTFGLVPAFTFSGRGMTASLRDSGRAGTAYSARQRLRATLVVMEVALATALVVGAGLFGSSFIRLLSVSEGFDYHRVLAVQVVPVSVGGTPTDRAQAGITVMESLAARLRGMSGVESVGILAGSLPFSGGFHRQDATIQGRSEPFSGDDGPDVYFATPEYFETLRIPIVRGRSFQPNDERAGAPAVVLLNQTAAGRYFGRDEAIGKQIGVPEIRTVIGIVGDVRPLGPETPLRPEAYSPLSQGQRGNGYIILRTTGDPLALAPTVRSLVSTTMPHRVVPAPQTLDALFGGLVAQRRFNAVLVGLFGSLALAIAAAGLYGVMSYLVAQRTQEIGIRMALGAGPVQMISMVLNRALWLVSTGLILGLGLAWTSSSVLSAFLFDVSPHEATVFGGVPLILLIVGLFAAYFPARRAALVDPLLALRQE
jgi:putative ABC transport system permease protein